MAHRSATTRSVDVETLAWTALRRYGVVFRRVLAREASGVPWRELRRSGPDRALVAISAASRIVYRNGVPIAAMEGDILKRLTEDVDPDVATSAAALAAGRRVPVVTRYVGRLG